MPAASLALPARPFCLFLVEGGLLVLATRFGRAAGPRPALLVLVVLWLRFEDERLAGSQRRAVVGGLLAEDRLVDRGQGLGLLELLVESRLALVLRLEDCIGNLGRDQLDRTDRVVVRRNDPVDQVRIAVCVGHRHDRDLEAACLCDRDRLAMRIDHEERARQAAHAADAAERGVEARDLLVELRGLLLGEALELAAVAPCLESLEALDAALDGREVGEHPTQPAVVHVVLATALRLEGDRLLGLLLGADEEDALPAPDSVTQEIERIVQAAYGLGEVDDVDPVALGEDVLAHLRVPPAGLVSEMDARLEQLLPGGRCHLGQTPLVLPPLASFPRDRPGQDLAAGTLIEGSASVWDGKLASSTAARRAARPN